MRLLIPIIALLLASACGREPSSVQIDTPAPAVDAPSEVSVALQCQSISESEEEPRFALYALVDEFKVKIAEINGCDTIGAESYADYQIPGDALAAAGGWWAGAGDYFYAQRAGNVIQFFHGQVDEEMEGDTLHYLKVVTYEGGRFSFNREE